MRHQQYTAPVYCGRSIRSPNHGGAINNERAVLGLVIFCWLVHDEYEKPLARHPYAHTEYNHWVENLAE